MERLIEKAKLVASEVIVLAGLATKEKFDQIAMVEEKDEFGDVVTEADHLAEKIILDTLIKQFPDHSITSEESGSNKVNSDWLWQVDPLDGTNNFAIGLPVYASSITLLYKNQPVLGVVYEPMVDRLFVAAHQKGATYNDQEMTVKKRDNPNRFTIGWIQGHAVRNEEKAVKLRQHIDLNCKRMLRTWAPTLTWAMLAKGDIDAVIIYNSEGEDLYSGLLMVKEAGGCVIDFEGNDFSGVTTTPYFIACHPDHKEYFMKLVQDGLGE
ncbi:inositol monophosphatase family protein [Sutcliffiella rhizosphaerae]|uniref:Fructose-1, 6-bisphosphatase/inositol-1-monophosphatase n=1 Tax=Sutcliffiella rhizosphaerae TaxID=2880967 RepID=A0ABM8YTM2_9BACI|nr:inositol monophosphatase family protein [Sutcliffiella rhizosphaerae]CAG9623315.1 Fructose-1, 6-bisphosphatase/inositol-1-monophosphatase [Sutcliffiella rhizosphaerae]